MLARNAAKNSGDPSWLAYSLYAPPNTVIQIGNRWFDVKTSYSKSWAWRLLKKKKY